jgi:hypothetical protein
VYPLASVQLLAPVLHPPSVRVFASKTSFEFANPAAISSPDAHVQSPAPLVVLPRLAAVVGADSEPAGLTLLAEWRRPGVDPPKDRDFALGLGPVVVTPDELDGSPFEVVVKVDGDERLRVSFDEFDWTAARDLAAAGTRLYPGDLLAGPPLAPAEVALGSRVEIEVPDVGVLAQSVSRD